MTTRKRCIQKMVSAIMIAAMILTVSAPQVMAASGKTKTMTVYDQVIVKGKYAYCSANKGVYKVNLKTKSKKLLVKAAMPEFDRRIHAMKIYRGYLYYDPGTGALSDGFLCRIKTSGKNGKDLVSEAAYAISNGKIYYITYGMNPDKYKKKQMKLNGKSKKKSSYKVKQKYKKSNKKGYYVKTVSSGNGYKDYLVMPNGKRLLLCKYTTLL